MPRADILSLLKNSIQNNHDLNNAVKGFVEEMNQLKLLFQQTQHKESKEFINYSEKVFKKWTIQELFLFLALFGNEWVEYKFCMEELNPAIVLEELFLFDR